MSDLISDAFKTFNEEAPEHAKAWGILIQELAGASALDPKTHHLAYLSVLSVLRRVSGIPFHVKKAREAGAYREEIISAVLVGLPAAGHAVTEALPAAIEAFDND